MCDFFAAGDPCREDRDREAGFACPGVRIACSAVVTAARDRLPKASVGRRACDCSRDMDSADGDSVKAVLPQRWRHGLRLGSRLLLYCAGRSVSSTDEPSHRGTYEDVPHR